MVSDFFFRDKIIHQRSAEFAHQQKYSCCAQNDAQQTVQRAGNGTEQHAPKQLDGFAGHKGNDHMKHMQQNIDDRRKGPIGFNLLLHDDSAVFGGKIPDPGPEQGSNGKGCDNIRRQNQQLLFRFF